jgi:predicted TIM-barrel fold metal-dependent hydrolase
VRVLLDGAGIERAVVTATPPAQVAELAAALPGRILPLLGAYETSAAKQDWYLDGALPARLQAHLAAGGWHGVGELHLFAEQRRNAVFEAVVDLAVRAELPLLLHTDPAVIDALYERHPQALVVWAHAGRYPYPPLLRDYLSRHPGLHVDLSMRDARIAPQGVLDPEWAALLIEFSPRFMVGADTFSMSRWAALAELSAVTRTWLSQLPPGVVDDIARDNAARIYGRASASFTPEPDPAPPARP